MAVSTIHHHHHHYSHLLHLYHHPQSLHYLCLSVSYTHTDGCITFVWYETIDAQTIGTKKISVHAVHCIGIYIRTYIFETSQHVRTFKWRQRCDVKYWHSTIDVLLLLYAAHFVPLARSTSWSSLYKSFDLNQIWIN